MSYAYPEKPQQQQQYGQPQQQGYGQQQQDYGQPQPAYGQQPVMAQPATGYAPMAPGYMPYQGPANPKWSHDFCTCMDDMDECLDTWCCHYCKIGWMQHRVETGFIGFDGLWCFGACCVDYFLFGIGTAVVAYMLRTRLIARYGIQEDGLHTAALGFCCPACALCQQAREMTVRGETCGGTVCKKAPPQPGPAMGQQPVQQQQGYYPAQQQQQGYPAQQQQGYPAQQQQGYH